MARNRNLQSFRGGRTTVRRKSLWLFITTTNTSLSSANASALIVSLNAAALALRPFTIVRTIGELLVVSDQLAAAETFRAAMGFAVVSDQASAIGVTAVPTPITDAGSDLWFTFAASWGRFFFLSASAASVSQNAVPFDSRAMRKVEDGQDVVAVIENEFAAGTTVGMSARMLIKTN